MVDSKENYNFDVGVKGLIFFLRDAHFFRAGGRAGGEGTKLKPNTRMIRCLYNQEMKYYQASLLEKTNLL